MQSRVERELADSDVALLILNGEEGVGPGDRFIAGALREPRCRSSSRSTRSTASTGRAPCAALQAAAELDVADDDLPDLGAHRARASTRSSSTSARCCPRARSSSTRRTPPTSRSRSMLAELIREQVLRRTFQEVPHAVEVIVDEIDDQRDDLTRDRRSPGSRPTPRRASSSARAAG